MKGVLIKYLLCLFLFSVLVGCDAYSDVTPPPNIASVSPTLNPNESSSEDKKDPAMENDQTRQENFVTVQVDGVIQNIAKRPIPQNLQVTLYGYYKGREMYSKSVPCDERDLSFSFKDVVSHVGWYFFASVEVDKQPYYSDVVQVKNSDTRIVLPIPVYEVTSDLSLLVMDKLYIVIEFINSDTVRVMEMIDVSNKSSKMIVSADPEQKGVFPYFIPKQAKQVEFVGGNIGERYIKTENGYNDTIPIMPGHSTYQNMVAFTLPIQRKLDYVQRLPVSTNEVMIFIPTEYDNHVLRVKGESISFYGNQSIEGLEYQVYKGTNFNANEKLQFVLIMNPKQLSIFEGVMSYLRKAQIDLRIIVGIFFFGIALIGGGTWMVINQRRKDLEGKYAIEMDNLKDADTIIESIIALDEVFKAGKISKELYLRKRAQLKAALAKHVNL